MWRIAVHRQPHSSTVSFSVNKKIIPNITGVVRLGIKAGPPASQSYALTTTLSAPRVLKFEK